MMADPTTSTIRVEDGTSRIDAAGTEIASIVNTAAADAAAAISELPISLQRIQASIATVQLRHPTALGDRIAISPSNGDRGAIHIDKLYTLQAVRHGILPTYLANEVHKPWCCDRAEGSLEDDELMAERKVDLRSIELLAASYHVLLLGRDGVGKSCFLHHLYALLQQNLVLDPEWIPKENICGYSKPSPSFPLMVPIFLSAASFYRLLSERKLENFDVADPEALAIVREIVVACARLHVESFDDHASVSASSSRHRGKKHHHHHHHHHQNQNQHQQHHTQQAQRSRDASSNTVPHTNDQETLAAEYLYLLHRILGGTDASSTHTSSSSTSSSISSPTALDTPVRAQVFDGEISRRGVRAMLFVDEIDLVPLDAIRPFLERLLALATSGFASPARVFVSMRPSTMLIALPALGPVLTREDLMEKDVNVVHLEPGPQFNVLGTGDISVLLSQWPMVDDEPTQGEGGDGGDATATASSSTNSGDTSTDSTNNNRRKKNSDSDADSDSDSSGSSDSEDDQQHRSARRFAFADTLRAHRRKLYPLRASHPFLLYSLARRLCASIVEMRARRDSFLPFPMSDAAATPPPSAVPLDKSQSAPQIAPSTSLSRPSINELGYEPIDDPATIDNMLPASADDQLAPDREFSLSELLESLLDDAVHVALRSAAAVAASTTPGGDEDGGDNNDGHQDIVGIVGQFWRTPDALKRACSLFGYLVHWIDSRMFEDLYGRNASSSDYPLPDLPADRHLAFVESHLRLLLDDERTAYRLGVPNQPDTIVAALLRVLGWFYDKSLDGRVVCKHPAFQEYLAARFLTDSEDFTQPILAALQACSLQRIEVSSKSNSQLVIMLQHHRIRNRHKRGSSSSSDDDDDDDDDSSSSGSEESDSNGGRAAGESAAATSAAAVVVESSSDAAGNDATPVPTAASARRIPSFSWQDAAFLTSYRWDHVVHFAGMRAGIVWLFRRMVGQQHSETPEQWLSTLSIDHGDLSDFGQIRFHLLLRVYAELCLYRPAHRTHSDPLTTAFGSAVLRLLQQAQSGALMHIEAYPVYFLACFQPHAARTVVDKCVELMVNRCSPHSLELVTRLYRSPYMAAQTQQLLEHHQMGENRRRLAVLKLLAKVDEYRLQKEYVQHVISALLDMNGIVRREAITILHQMGVMAARQLPPANLAILVPNGDVVSLISSSIAILALQTDYAEADAYLSSAEKRIIKPYQQHMTTIKALLEQPDAGARFLAFLVLHNPDLCLPPPGDRPAGSSGSGSSSSANAIDELAATKAIDQRRAALLQVCKVICSRQSGPLTETFAPTGGAAQVGAGTAASTTAASSPTSARSAPALINSGSSIDGGYYFTVALSSIVSDTLGETAACWVSSVIELLQCNQQLVLMVNARVFSRLPLQHRSRILTHLLAPPATIPLSSSSAHHRSSSLGSAATLAQPDPRDIRYWGLLVLKETPVSIQREHLEDITTLMVDNSASEIVRVGAIQLYRHVVTGDPSSASLSILRTLMLDQNPRIATAAVETWDDLVRVYNQPLSAGNKDVVMSLVLNFRYQPYAITVAALNMLAHHIPPELLDPSDIPLVRLLSHDNASVRAATIRVVGKLARMFTADGEVATQLVEALAAHQRWYSRAAVISALGALLKSLPVESNERQRVISIVLSALAPTPIERRNLFEGAIHVLGTLRASAPMPVQQRLAELLRTKSEDYRLQVALLSAIQQFPLEFLVQQLPLIFECLFSDDNEVREAASNIFTTRAKCFQTLETQPDAIQEYLKRACNSDKFYQREALLVVFEAFGGRMVIDKYKVILNLLNDQSTAVRTRSMKLLREVVSQQLDGWRMFVSAVGSCLKSKDHRVRREAVRLMRCNKEWAAAHAQQFTNMFSSQHEMSFVKIQCLKALGEVGPLPEACVPNIIEFLKATETRVLAAATMAITNAGINGAVLVPKLINAMDARELAGIKRKLMRFMHFHRDELGDLLLATLPEVMVLMNNEDSIVRRKAVQIVGAIARRLARMALSEFVVQAWDHVIRELCRALLDKNALVRKESCTTLGVIGTVRPDLIPVLYAKMVGKAKGHHLHSIIIWRCLSLQWGQFLPLSSGNNSTSSTKS